MRKYSAAAIAAAALLTGPLALSASAGTSPSEGADSHQGIIGGKVATKNPGAVGLLDEKGALFCTGSQISPEWVLTAAHCIRKGGPMGGKLRLPSKIRLGSLHSTEGGTEVGVKTGLIKPGELVDAALIKLATPNKQYPMVKLATANPTKGDTIRVFGWGYTKDDDKVTSKDLKYGDLTVTLNDSPQGSFRESFSCQRKTGEPRNGDSGGPAFKGDVQVGIVSMGDFSNGKYRHDFHKVAGSREWIKKEAGV